MDALPKPLTDRGSRLLTAHLESLDPEALQARERLDLQLRRARTQARLRAHAASADALRGLEAAG